MKRTQLLLATLVAASTISAACTRFERTTEILLPTAPGAVPTAPAPSAPAAPAPPSGSGSMAGTWSSDLITAASSGSCANFQWQVTSATSTSMAGNFSAVCGGNINVVGTASGRLEGNQLPLAVAGTATYAGVLSCEFILSGTGTIGDNETSLTIPYTGTICGTAVSGTERLHRPAPAASPEPTPAPAPSQSDPLFGCGGIPDKLQLVQCIHGNIRPTDQVGAFEVAKRVAWALRGEGAGLLIKNGGENIAAWQGRLFSASRIRYPDGRLVKVISDAGPGGANAPSWQDNGDYVDPGLYVPAMDPNLP